jgi:hypothetical protein
MQDQKTSGTNGGAISSGSWVTRTLNTIIANDLSIASLAANQITLPAGTYQCSIVVPGFAVDNHQARLFNVSSNTALLYGPNSRGASTGSNFSYALVVGLFVLLSSQVVRVEQQVQTTNGTNGLGMAMSFGSTEVYTVVQLWLVGGPPPIGAQRTDYRRPILYPQQPWNTTAHLGLLGIANAPI